MNHLIERWRVILAVALLWACAPGSRALAQAADIVMVVNRANSAEVSKNDAKALLLGETAAWPDKSKVVIALPPAGDAQRDDILKKLCGINETIYTRRQLLAAFNGTQAVAIREAASPAAVKSFVRANPGAVGFLRKSDADDSVRIVLAVN